MNSSDAQEDQVLNIGSRLEPFVDRYLIDSIDGVELKLHPPTPRDVALCFDRPWEGTTCFYVTVMHDDDRYRLYYRGSKHVKRHATEQNICYAESQDGITWTRPSLGICEFEGSTGNNIIRSDPEPEWEKCVISHNFMPFKDGNPNAPDEERYKGVAAGPVIAFASPDGIHWNVMREEPIIDPYARCDRQGDYISLAFWDGVQGQYVAYVRGWRTSPSTLIQCGEDSGRSPGGIRQVLRCTSPDFVNWSEPRFLDFGDSPLEHFYTNATTPYFRAPHIYLAFPKRFVPERKRIDTHPQMGLSDAVFMSSRDGIHFDRTFMEAFIRPGRDPHNWTERNMLPAWGVVPTGDDEISVYYIENYRYPTCRLRRGALRTDGFVSVHAGYGGGEFVTKPLVFDGSELLINYATSAVGSVSVEVQDVKGKPLPGYTLEDAGEIYGDEIEHTVQWKEEGHLGHLSGQPVRLRFAMKDADLYSIRFC